MAEPGVLRLEVREFTDLTSWRWALVDEASGKLLTGHEVRLSQDDWQFEAFGDVHEYLAWQVAPDQRDTDEPRMVAQIGDWIAVQVLGPVAAELVNRARRRPVTVRVVAPGVAAPILLRPLELAHVNGKPLAAQDVTLVMQPGPDDASGAGVSPGRARLRVLGLFSQPDGGQALNLRRERHALVQLVHGIAAAGKAADVRVLQYGVTRELLQDVLAEHDGWDIIHISGHGAPGVLLLETRDGQPDRLDAAQLADLLAPAREHVKLVTIAACWSAALTAAEQRRRLGLPLPERSRASRDPQSSPGTLATELCGRLGCAVLAMRYPVDDEFAITLSRKLYDLLLAKGNPLPQAVGRALRQLSGQPFPALSLATPALFGGTAPAVLLTAPDRDDPANYDPARLKMAGFPPLPPRFVGRTSVMARSSAALAPDSGVPGVLLHGMPGGGKTACALELAYGHEHAVEQLVWYKAPDEGMAIDGALTDFALTLERYLDGFQMAHLLVSAETLDRFLPLLTQLLEERRLLLVIDNAESLLTDSGQWRDDNWAKVIGALTDHAGLGRLILTSRRVPAGTAGSTGMPGLRVESVDALLADEALLLARELPHLKKLIYGELPGIDRETSRRLALGVLTVAQGHPKLLELANGQAAHPDRLAALIAAGDQAWREQGGLPEGFFTATAGETTASPADYLTVLGAWTQAVADSLSPGERDLFWFLCCLEEPDRERSVLDGNWADLRQRLSRDGPPPEMDAALAAIAARGLAAIDAGSSEAAERYAIHPGVAAAGRDQAGPPFRDAVDAAAAAYWNAVHRYASGGNDAGSVHTGLLVRAGLAGAGYYLRQQHWNDAAYLLEDAFLKDPSRAHAAAVLPAIQQITRHYPPAAGVLASVLVVIDPAAAEATLRAALDDAVARGDYRAASVAAGRLVYLCRDSGRLAEALHLAGQMADYTRRAGLGPWTQLTAEARRLQVLNAMGQAGQVLAEVGRLRARMEALPATPAADGPTEASTPWNVREMLLDTGREAARLVGRWQEALELNAAILASMRGRRAPAADIARSRFNDYFPLLSLGRTGDALALLLEVRQVFQDAHDTEMLGKTLSALADAEDQRGHGDAAIRLERDALRYKYLAGDVPSVAISYHNLGNYLRRHARQPAPALASHLTAALIEALAGTDDDGQSANAAATDLRELGAAAVPPRDVADLCDRLADIPGTDLPRLIAALSSDPENAEQALRDLTAQARQLAAAPARATTTPKRRWWGRRAGRERSG
jgi:hypothetical protein